MAQSATLSFLQILIQGGNATHHMYRDYPEIFAAWQCSISVSDLKVRKYCPKIPNRLQQIQHQTVEICEKSEFRNGVFVVKSFSVQRSVHYLRILVSSSHLTFTLLSPNFLLKDLGNSPTRAVLYSKQFDISRGLSFVTAFTSIGPSPRCLSSCS